MSILIDTSVFFAFYSKKDRYHQDALAVMLHASEGRWGRPQLTDYVLDETVTLLKNKVSPKTALAIFGTLENSGPLRLIRLDEDSLNRSIEIFKNYAEKPGFSFTDATTVSIMKDYAIEHLASLDQRSFSGIFTPVGAGYFQSLSLLERKRIRQVIPRT